ncbi:large ribosomal subunit protein P2-like [Babylonia areolata]|uniref:large ribosomal subunit protein P2-like n=1 Tax=Babylonia areolata TaxID=304850 RepID=UPI003FCF0760
MRYVAAYLLAAMGNAKEDPSAADVEKILSSVGIEAEADKVKKVVGELAGKSLEELIAEGATRLASMPAGGAVPSGGAAAAPAAAGEAAPAEAKKEEKKEESEESDDDMGFGLFD